jgi:hypothetical protein
LSASRFAGLPDKFYKGGSQEKTLLLWPEFFLLPSPVIERDGSDRPRHELGVFDRCEPAIRVFPTSGFHRLSQRSYQF